jgi:glycosyltransferase involved in cell wall biosynthesis
MKSLRVLQAMAGQPHGGAEAFFERLAIALHHAGLDQRIVIRREPARAARLRAAGLEPRELRFGGALDFFSKPALAREIKTYRPHIVLSWMSRATAFVPAKGDFVRVARLGGYYDLKYYKQCDHLIGNTRDIVTYLRRKGWRAERAHYIPNFVDEVRAPPVDRATLDTPADALVLLALGRLHPNKGFDVLLDALARVPGAILWLAGEGELRGALQAQAQRLGIAARVRFLGWRDDVAALLGAADMLVCPSRHEPLGNVILEAWAQGRPVVAAASQGPAALITPDYTGLLVRVDDAASLAAAIARVGQDRRLAGELAANGRAAYAAEFTEERVVARYMEFFAKVTL